MKRKNDFSDTHQYGLRLINTMGITMKKVKQVKVSVLSRYTLSKKVIFQPYNEEDYKSFISVTLPYRHNSYVSQMSQKETSLSVTLGLHRNNIYIEVSQKNTFFL